MFNSFPRQSVFLLAQNPQEADYIPSVKEFISLSTQFEKPQAGANAISRSANKKPAKAKGKAKAKVAA